MTAPAFRLLSCFALVESATTESSTSLDFTPTFFAALFKAMGEISMASALVSSVFLPLTMVLTALFVVMVDAAVIPLEAPGVARVSCVPLLLTSVTFEEDVAMVPAALILISDVVLLQQDSRPLIDLIIRPASSAHRVATVLVVVVVVVVEIAAAMAALSWNCFFFIPAFFSSSSILIKCSSTHLPNDHVDAPAVDVFVAAAVDVVTDDVEWVQSLLLSVLSPNGHPSFATASKSA